MVKRMKAGKKGSSANYITRAQALKRLQLSLQEFRRLCILKGVYPREPKRKLQGADKTYYHIKDITFLMQDPLVSTSYSTQAYLKKHRRMMARKDYKRGRTLEKFHKPKQDLSHLIKERYPTFDAALRDLDDCVASLAMFAHLPADQVKRIKPEQVAEARRLYDEFLFYVIHTGRLTKVFASIKGYYFEAQLPYGAVVCWLQPHNFAPRFPAEVDMNVLNTFGEWYRTLLRFVNFKLFKEVGWRYPPTHAAMSDERADTSSTSLATIKVEKAPKTMDVDGDETKKGIFKGLVFWVSREVALAPIYTVLVAGGAEVKWLKENMNDGDITHCVVDRPMLPDGFDETSDRDVIQPQWVLDSFNEGILLPVAEYGLGKALPPHLSPFVDDSGEGYVPDRRKVLDDMVSSMAGKKNASGLLKATADAMNMTDEVDDRLAERDYLREMKAEMRHKEAAERINEAEQKAEREKEVAKRAEEKAQEKMELQKSMLSKKHAKLLSRIEFGKASRDQKAAKLTQKKKEAKAKTGK
ncbi:mRNA-binding ribosome synthesis protein [Perkinsus olseni]|uniref:Pescadillo homolog n=1 Tax=Perkinsus olseni TaxID=32597 RepID=A0A7J6SJZ4_PEROL|nr:mRNA-binding ribosome synthesis protein [Perkinsus olseni]KAF4749381.1 mRNA-binding ribosome synthesis protein [Perkinsus olseni]